MEEDKLKVWRDKDAQFAHVMTLMRVNDAIAMVLEGKPRQEIINYLVKKYGLAESTSNLYIVKANNQIKARKQWELDALIDLHLARYEHIYGLCLKLGSTGLAAQVLKAKERLLQFHKHDKMTVKNEQIMTISTFDARSEYDKSKLGPRRERLEELLSKMR